MLENDKVELSMHSNNGGHRCSGHHAHAAEDVRELPETRRARRQQQLDRWVPLWLLAGVAIVSGVALGRWVFLPILVWALQLLFGQ